MGLLALLGLLAIVAIVLGPVAFFSNRETRESLHDLEKLVEARQVSLRDALQVIERRLQQIETKLAIRAKPAAGPAPASAEVPTGVAEACGRRPPRWRYAGTTTRTRCGRQADAELPFDGRPDNPATSVRTHRSIRSIRPIGRADRIRRRHCFSDRNRRDRTGAGRNGAGARTEDLRYLARNPGR
jgi:hypothetical protein